MKNNLFLLLLLIPLIAFAKFHKGEIIYNDGSVSSVEISLPINAVKQKLTVKKGNNKISVDISEIKYLIVILSNNEKFIFKRGKLSRANKTGEIKTNDKTDVLSLIDYAYDDIIVSCDALQYVVKKVKGKERMIAIYYGGISGYVLSNPNDEKLFFFHNTTRALKNSINRTQDYLFLKCPGFAESINYKELNKRGSFVHEIAKEYNNCIKN